MGNTRVWKHPGLASLKSCEGFIRHRPPGPHPRIRLALPSSGVDWHRNRLKAGNRCRINVESMLNRCQIEPWGGEGEVDSRVGSRGSVPNKPLTRLKWHKVTHKWHSPAPPRVSHFGATCLSLRGWPEKPRLRYFQGQNYYRQSCYSWEFISRKLPLPLPSWNLDELPLPLPSWPPQSPLDFHWLPITI